MKKIILIIVALIIVLFWQFNFIKNLQKEVDFLKEKVDFYEIFNYSEEPYIIGRVYSVSENRFLVAEGIEGDKYDGDINRLKGKAIWFTSEEEVKKGQKVKVWSEGLILESYPAQGKAGKIEFIKECFVGGCSGELCTDNPEAISTCELLPGMECLEKEMSCSLVEEDCKWVLSKEAAECFLSVKEKEGDKVTETRIGNLFQKAEELLK